MISNALPFTLVVVVCASGLTVAAQAPAPASPQPATPVAAPAPARPSGQTQTPAGTPRLSTTGVLGPIVATGTNAAYVPAQSTGNPLVFLGSDATPYGLLGTASNHGLGFLTNNTARLYINTIGQVGIGTTAPSFPLDVVGDANITGIYRVNGVPISATSNWTQAGSAISYTTGNVGIGTTTPGYLLDVAGRMRVRGSPGNTAGIWFHSAAPGNEPVFVGMLNDTLVGCYGRLAAGCCGAGWGMGRDTTSGYVGMGTTVPGAKLDVVTGDRDGIGVRGSPNHGSLVLSTGIGVMGPGTRTLP